MSNVKVTQLPGVVNAQLTDIIYTVQGGVSSQETLQQISTLMNSNAILSYPGNPNGNLAGSTYQLCWDTTNLRMYVCTTTGSTTTAIWTIIVNSAGVYTWNTITLTSQLMSNNNGYIANNAGLVTLTLPVTSGIGDELSIIGLGAGGWRVAQNASQYIQIGTSNSTVGAGGSISSTNRYDVLNLVCTVANTSWSTYGAPQGILTVV
jgi:hypothetical protein